MKTTIEELAIKYFAITGNSPEFSFWSWLDSIGAVPDEQELKEILENIYSYI
jgi:hypothetical protein